ncbi:winged helix-turn-helix phosphate transcriptional response regulator [Geotalea daltonii FRC-32]|uniref:Phosphate regulon transcriptional regulatory protein PhoB n=1 Tax=Geotalea daltonii (strain DSM 22248 / JCM 15807 / FRC-32) TaxID=316067 RepID=B9M889_GEODF|nr:response regulator transcription factor [Geotalea daltonii]ACM20355.1 winged helix-turn-helix phosphate transcriptional response regulator [Geotalea daltonii FRC-32]
MHTILVIEDERDLAELIAFNLEKEGHRPLIALDGLVGLEAARKNPPDLILLDLMLPGMAGTEICKILKGNGKTASIPVIMLTAKGEEIDRVVGFEVGADDYIVKPFSTRELMLRVKALLRRTLPEQPRKKVFSVGPVSIDTERHLVTVADKEILLTTIEYKLLLDLAERAGRVQSRDILLQNVWGYNYVGDSRTVDTHVTRLRTKLGSAGDMIKTVRGFGYKIEEE